MSIISNFFKRLLGKSQNQSEKTHTSTKTKENTEDLENEDIATDKDSLLKMLENMLNSDIETNTPELFKLELHDSLTRYQSMPIPFSNKSSNFKDENEKIIEDHEYFSDTFNEWKKIHSVADRRALLLDLWDKQMLFSKMQTWQLLERLLKDKRPFQAYELFEKSDKENIDIREFIALSKIYRSLGLNDVALQYAKKAFDVMPDLQIARVEYANTLYLSPLEKDRELSQNIINAIIEEKVQAEPKGAQIAFFNYFIFSENYIESSIFAGHFLKNTNADDITWQHLADEYYWCPFFRLEHAIFLINKGFTIEALAKFNSLTQDFPWYKSAVEANINVIQKLREQNKNPDFLSEEMAQLEVYKIQYNY